MMKTKLPITSTQTVMLHPADLKELAAFYEQVLEFPILDDQRDEGWIVFDAGNVQIALHHPVGTGTGGQPKLVFQSNDLDTTHDYLKSKAEAEATIQIIVGTIHTSASERFFDASGPDGHEFRFVQRHDA